jgi:hypothetical protein
VNTDPAPGAPVRVTPPPIMRASFRVMARPRPAVATRGERISLSEFLEQVRLLLDRHADSGIRFRALSTTYDFLITRVRIARRFVHPCGT